MRTMKSIRILTAALVLGLACLALAANLGPNDRQISFTGSPGSTETDAVSPAIAFDPGSQRYLLVWSADETDGEFRIMGRLLSGAAGEPVGPAFALGTSPDGTDQRQPAVACNEAEGLFLVVWSGDDLVRGAREIMGRMVDADGRFVGPVRRYSDMGSDDLDPAFDAITPDVAWAPMQGAFTLVWAADDDAGLLTDGRFEVYGQLVDDADGTETGANDFRITYSLSDDKRNDVLEPAVAVIPSSDRWFVMFEGDVVDDEIHDPEIWGYGVTGDVPDGAGFNVSLMGGSVYDGLSARHPDVVYVGASNELFCVWNGQDGSGNSPAIFGQRLLTDGTPTGAMLALSTSAGSPWGTLEEASRPVVQVDPVAGNLYVAWHGDIADGQPHNDPEVFGCSFDNLGNPLDPFAFPQSDMDSLQTPVPGAGPPAVAINVHHGYKMLAWSGDLQETPGDEYEIFVQGWSDDALSAVDDTPAATFTLHGAAPNPFNPQTTIAFDLPRAMDHSLRIYDTAGRLVRTLRSGAPGLAGRNEVVWDGRDDGGRQASSGVYLYRLEAGGHGGTGRMTLVK